VPEAVLLTTALLVSVFGMAWFALAKDAHWKQLHGGRPLTRRTQWRLRLLGTAALLGSFALCLAADHVSMAVLVWVMALAPAAMLVAFTLSWRPAWLAFLAPRGWAMREAP